MAPDRTGGGGDFAGDFKLARKQMPQTAVVHHQHDQINALRADLQAPASSADADESRRAPSCTGAAHSHSAPVLGTDDEASFDQMRNYHDAFGVLQHFFRNALIGSGR